MLDVAKKKAGRPRKIDAQLIAQMRMYMIAGVSLKDACKALEITYSAWNKFEKANPDYSAKRKSWQSMLEARSKLIIADEILNKKDVSTAVWYLERLDKKSDKDARNELTRAQAKKYRVEAELAEKQNLQVDNATNATTAKMKELSLDELRALAKMAKGNEDE